MLFWGRESGGVKKKINVSKSDTDYRVLTNCDAGRTSSLVGALVCIVPTVCTNV